jgi:hypothetical protein
MRNPHARIPFQNRLQEPSRANGRLQSAFNTELQLFFWLMQHPQHMSDSNDLMEGQRINRIERYAFVDVENVLFKDQDTSDPNAALFVDVGGNRGQNVEPLRKLYPKAQGKIVLQDLPPVIADVKELDINIVRMGYDFFSPQPIIG